MLGDTDFERWEGLVLQKTLDSMADVAYCPRCETACLEDEKNNAQCSKCLFSFCTRCKDRRHIGERCITPEEKLLSLEERSKVRHLSKGNIGRRNTSLANEIIGVKEVLRCSVPCPHCGTAISRVSGCNHMRCGNCGKEFCYGCGNALDRDHTRIDREKLTMKMKAVDIIKVGTKRTKSGSVET